MGGRASRLDGAAKGDLRVGGRTLLERVVAAAGVARDRVVVGDAGASVLPPEVRVVREEPPFGGPAAAVAAGVHELADDADAVLLLAGDQPFVAEAVPLLLAALPGPGDGDGARAVDGHGRRAAPHLRRPSCGARHRDRRRRRRRIARRRLDATAARAAADGGRGGAGARDDGRGHLGRRACGRCDGRRGTMSVSDEEFERLLADWADRVRAELGVPDAPLDIQQVLGVAGVAAHAVMRPAAPITTYLAGYAAGVAAAGGADAEAAARDALDRVRRLASP